MIDLYGSLLRAASHYLRQRPFDDSSEDERLCRLGVRLRESADAYARVHLADRVVRYGGPFATIYRSWGDREARGC